METPHLELREGDGTIFELYKDGLSTGKLYNFEDEVILELSDELFDLTAAGMPAGIEITVFPRFNGKQNWIAWIDAKFDNRYVNIHLDCRFQDSENEDEQSILNPHVLASRIIMESWSYGFITESTVDDVLMVGFDKKFSSKGILRDKIKTAIGIIETLKAKAEDEMLEAISNGQRFMKMPDLDKINPAEKK
jgi:hypothetical protein